MERLDWLALGLFVVCLYALCKIILWTPVETTAVIR